MRLFTPVEKSVALTLVLAVGSLGLPAAASPSSAALVGKVLRAGSGEPVAGATVKLAHRPDSKLFESTKTDVKGDYTLAGLPAGTYDLAIEADGGLYVVGGAGLALQPGERRTMSLAVQPAADEPPPSGQNPPPAPETPPPSPTPAPQPATPTQAGEKKKEEEKKKPKGAFWRSPWGGTIIIVGSALILGGIASSSDNDNPATASPSKN